MKPNLLTLVLTSLLCTSGAAQAQHHHQQHNDNATASSAGKSETAAGEATPQRMHHASQHGMEHGSHQALDTSTQPPTEAVADSGAGPRSPDYSDGYTDAMAAGMHMPDAARHGALLVDHLEHVRAKHGRHAAAFDGEYWYGSDLDKLWLKLEGHKPSDADGQWRMEALWSHAMTPFWDWQLGVRHDLGPGPERNWLAVGIEGLAPYWLETTATLYLGPDGRTAARFEMGYEMLLTQRLILEPSVEVTAWGKDDVARGIDAGLGDAALGLRLRYEVRREFAPYVGVERQWHQHGGAETVWVAGLRLWY